MKELFPGYYRKSDNEIRKIWEKGIILFDTNVLLNLYRYSDSTRETLIELISKFSKQIYLPHQAALEYNRNKYEVIAEQEKAYKEFLDKISQIQKDLQSTSKPPFLTSKVDKDLNSIFEKVSAEVQDSITKYCDYLKQDPIYRKISELFKGRITQPFSEEELKEIYKEGEERYKMKIPPGFEDEKTKDGIRKFGDLVLWKQVLEKAKELKRDVILVTDERKLDWWWKIKDGRNMGARQELVEEIMAFANVDFHMYSSERFLSYGQTFLKEKINENALEEIQAMKKAELEEIHRIKFSRNLFENTVLKIQTEIEASRKRLDDVNSKLLSLRKHSDSLYRESDENENIQEYIHSIGIHTSELEDEKIELMTQIDNLRTLLIKSELAEKDDLIENNRIRYFFEKNINNQKR
jgi:hypothetical protein